MCCLVRTHRYVVFVRQVHVLKQLNLDGPLIFPVSEDLPFLARPLSPAERTRAQEVPDWPRPYSYGLCGYGLYSYGQSKRHRLAPPI